MRENELILDDVESLSEDEGLTHDDSGLSLIDLDTSYNPSDVENDYPTKSDYNSRLRRGSERLKAQILHWIAALADRFIYGKNGRILLRFLYSWLTYLLKFISCNACILLGFGVLYFVLFWALMFRIFSQHRSYSHQGISHPFSLDLSKPHPSADILVRQKWFIRRVHPKSIVKIDNAKLELIIYKGWNVTTSTFTASLEAIDSFDHPLWHTRKSAVLPPSALSLTPKKKWLPFLSKPHNVDETFSFHVTLIDKEDFFELENLNQVISGAHILRITIDTNDIKIAASRLHLTPVLSGYAHMVRHHLFITIVVMSIGLFFVVICCYGVTISVCCCFCIGRGEPKTQTQDLTEASWSRTTFNRLRLMRDRRNVVDTPRENPEDETPLHNRSHNLDNSREAYMNDRVYHSRTNSKHSVGSRVSTKSHSSNQSRVKHAKSLRESESQKNSHTSDSDPSEVYNDAMSEASKGSARSDISGERPSIPSPDSRSYEHDKASSDMEQARRRVKRVVKLQLERIPSDSDEDAHSDISFDEVTYDNNSAPLYRRGVLRKRR